MAFRGHDETNESVNRGNYREVLSLFGKYDTNFNNFLGNNIFSGTIQYFNNIYERQMSHFEPPQKKRKLSLDVADLGQSYKQIFVEILDTIIVQIEVRFGDLQKLNFFDLLTFEKFPLYCKTFPQSLLEDLFVQYPFFDQIQLKTN